MVDYLKELWGKTWPWLAGSVAVALLVLVIAMPKCEACWHPSHKSKICGYVMSNGRCVCREDK